MECISILTQPPYITQAAYITGKVGTHNTVILLDSGASCSVLSKTHIPLEHIQPEHKIRLLNADGRTLLPAGVAQVNVVLGDFQTTQTFVIADNLSTPVILGCDFLNRHGFIINFKNCTVTTPDHQGLQLILQMKKTTSKPCNTLTIDDELPQAIPSTIMPHSTQDIDLPDDVHPDLKQVIDDHKLLFTRRLGKTMTAEHFIDTGNATPVKVPPRPIPFHYTERVTKQLEDMAKEGTIRLSNSP